MHGCCIKYKFTQNIPANTLDEAQAASKLKKRLLLERMDEFAKKYPQYAHLMPVRESVYKLDRLEGLQYSVRMQQLEMGAVTQKEIQEHLNRQALRGGNVAAEAMGFGENFYAVIRKKRMCI